MLPDVAHVTVKNAEVFVNISTVLLKAQFNLPHAVLKESTRCLLFDSVAFIH